MLRYNEYLIILTNIVRIINIIIIYHLYDYNFVLQYIGSLDVPRPTSRVEIVAAMRRIRVSIWQSFEPF